MCGLGTGNVSTKEPPGLFFNLYLSKVNKSMSIIKLPVYSFFLITISEFINLALANPLKILEEVSYTGFISKTEVTDWCHRVVLFWP